MSSNTYERRNFGKELVAFDGKPIQSGVGVDTFTMSVVQRALEQLPEDIRMKAVEAINKECGKPLTLSQVCISALGSQLKGEESLTEGDQITRLQLAFRVNKEGQVKIKVPVERDLIKECVRKRWPSPLIAGQACLLLEGKEVVASPVEDDEAGEAGKGGSKK